MKKVAILTFDKLMESRSFFWDEVAANFKAKVSSIENNRVTLEEDGLCVRAGEAVDRVNNSHMVRFVNNIAVLGDFKLQVIPADDDDPAHIDLSTVGYTGVITELNFLPNTSYPKSTMYDLQPNDVINLGMSDTFRLDYLKDDRVVVMDIFLLRDYTKNYADGPIYGYVNVVIDALSEDFNNVPNEYEES